MNTRSNVGPAAVPAMLGGLLLMAGIALAQAPGVPAAPAASLPAAGVGGAVPPKAGAEQGAAAVADDARPPAASGSIYPTAYRPRRFPACPPCPQEGMPAAPAAPTEPGIKPEPGVVQPEPEMPAPEAASPTALAGTFGAATGPGSAAPYMIGDFFGGGSRFTGLGATNASVGVAGGDRRFKIVESNTPMPQDRLFFNYHHFENAVVDMSNGVHSLNRYTFGIEKTFGNKQNSLEFRLPFTSGYSSDQELGEGASLTGSELGDFAWAYKRILIQNDRFAVSAGLGVVYPTGDDWRITAGQRTLVLVENEATHLQPFLGAVWQPNDRLFFQTFTQFDFDTTGNNVFMLGGVDGETSRLAYVGTLQEQNLMFIDLSAGYWVYQNPCRGWLTGIAPVIELHYSTTMQDGDEFVGAQGVIGNDPTVAGTGFGRRDVLNLTAGMHFQMGTASTLTVAAVAPLRSGDDREYDSEFSVQFNRRF